MNGCLATKAQPRTRRNKKRDPEGSRSLVDEVGDTGLELTLENPREIDETHASGAECGAPSAAEKAIIGWMLRPDAREFGQAQP